MNVTATNNLQQANQHYLMAALAPVRQALQRQARLAQGKPDKEQEEEYFSPENELSPHGALEKLCSTFGLSNFERDLLLLCVGMELDASWGSLCAIAQGVQERVYPTFSLALTILPNPEWSALTPNAPLRRWRLIDVGSGNALTAAPLRIDEQILHYIAGVQHLDERLMGIVEPVAAVNILVPSHHQLAQRLAQTWIEASQEAVLPIICLCGDDVASMQAIALKACELLEMNLNAIFASTVPTGINELNNLMRLWEREAILSNSVLLLEWDDTDVGEGLRESAIATMVERIRSPLVIISRDRRKQRQRPLIAIEVPKASPSEQRAIWQAALGDAAISLNGHVETLVSHFTLSATTIYAACAEAKGKLATQAEAEDSPIHNQLWDTCRIQARSRLNDLAQPIIPGATWDELVLPETQRQVLRDIAAHVRQRAKVYESWGFAGKGGRGLGISALFAGASGTGKTMAAEVIAGELRLDLYRIDLSSVISKYIGETEKNLRRVFDAAEAGGAILLFDEADALFGKRSEVKDSHDRHANIEVSYLLQRMESYRGLAILTTNLKGSLDQAFLRRIRFIVQFSFPDANQRAEIWQRIFPNKTPTQGLEARKLAQLNVAGGNIRNIALNAAFIAADAGEPVGMKHVLQAAKSEYVKLERPLTDTEVKGWV
ncbi:ATP-binding protein [Trichocoleus sp. FACHB-90]|uniref:ATP-binding protein n=1 Tax=Cyanophyceae TaxID=3028117 RepID=UPI0016896A89|nr:ATP-binding protein [Trichocoleus sp. FACHB-90]MBD1928525.1 ATP-binding protein [Trichocoleus sp. FACHB-90]